MKMIGCFDNFPDILSFARKHMKLSLLTEVSDLLVLEEINL